MEFFHYKSPFHDDITNHLSHQDSRIMVLANSEYLWRSERRPYYNLYPSICEILGNTRLDCKPSQIVFPVKSLLIRFSEGNLKTILVGIFNQGISLSSQVEHNGKLLGTQISFAFRDDTLENIIQQAGRNFKLYTDQPSDFKMEEITIRMMRIVLGVALISQDEKWVTKIVLKRDEEKYLVANEEQKLVIEERAARINGVGFAIGKELEERVQRGEISPHYRKEHWAWYWTGKGRQVPKLIMRSGCVVQSHKNEVPTGYFG